MCLGDVVAVAGLEGTVREGDAGDMWAGSQPLSITRMACLEPPQ